MGGEVQPRTLYVVATPIGNLEDMTYRAVRILGQVDRVACEDTRVTRRLLAHFAIAAAPLRHDAVNESGSADGLVALLRGGASVALVSDAGTPTLSDPGYELVRRAVEAGLAVVPVPGPSALLAALAASGLPAAPLTFHGFLPKRKGERRAALGALAPGTHAFFCPARDLGAVLADLAALLPEAEAVVARELTKRHETFYRGSAAELAAELADGGLKGEAVLLLRVAARRPEATDDALLEDLARRLGAGLKLKDAAARVAEAHGVSRRRVYQLGLGRDAAPTAGRR